MVKASAHHDSTHDKYTITPINEEDGATDGNQNAAKAGASAAGIRALSMQVMAFYFRAPIKAFFRTRVDYMVSITRSLVFNTLDLILHRRPSPELLHLGNLQLLLGHGSIPRRACSRMQSANTAGVSFQTKYYHPSLPMLRLAPCCTLLT